MCFCLWVSDRFLECYTLWILSVTVVFPGVFRYSVLVIRFSPPHEWKSIFINLWRWQYHVVFMFCIVCICICIQLKRSLIVCDWLCVCVLKISCEKLMSEVDYQRYSERRYQCPCVSITGSITSFLLSFFFFFCRTHKDLNRIVWMSFDLEGY